MCPQCCQMPQKPCSFKEGTLLDMCLTFRRCKGGLLLLSTPILSLQALKNAQMCLSPVREAIAIMRTQKSAPQVGLEQGRGVTQLLIWTAA